MTRPQALLPQPNKSIGLVRLLGLSVALSLAVACGDATGNGNGNGNGNGTTSVFGRYDLETVDGNALPFGGLASGFIQLNNDMTLVAEFVETDGSVQTDTGTFTVSSSQTTVSLLFPGDPPLVAALSLNTGTLTATDPDDGTVFVFRK